MDASIRKLLANAENYTGEKNLALQQAYTLLRNVAETRPAVDAPESFGQDLYVLCAEFAFRHGNPTMARECLKMFFMKQPAANQFLCRAYLCQAQLMAPQNANSPEQFEKAVVYVLKAISFAKKSSRYHFLVYNASVIYWQFCRPFLKPGYRQYLARSLHQVVKALDDIEEQDYEWRAQLMIALIECHLDAHRRSDASHIASAAAAFIKTNVPSLYKSVFGLMVRYQLVETAKLHKDLKASPELAVFYKICKLKNSMDQEENKDFTSDIQNILNQMGISQKQSLLTRSQERLSRRDSKQAVGGTSSSSSPRDEPEPERRERKSPAKGGRRTPTPTTSRKIATDSLDNLCSEDRPMLLLELSRLCLELDLPDLASLCVDSMKICTVKDAAFHLELEFVQCELMVRLLGDKHDSYQKSVVDTRLQAIKRCEEAIMNAIRLGDPNVIQVGCVTQWNLCLLLLQPNLRHLVRRPLTHVAEALEDIDSLLVQLRCQVYTELSRCEEDQEQIQVAMENLKKALSLDDGSVYHERLEVSLRRLELRAELYKQPDRPEDQAAMIIEQARKADSGTIRMKRSLLVKAGEALAPDAFLLVLDSENDTKAKEALVQDISNGKGPLTKIRQLAGKALQFNNCVRKAEGHLKRLGDENDRERARLWGDLAKTARKQEVWDVCRVASRFCLLYDDGRWKNTQSKRSDSPKPEKSRSDTARDKDDSEGDKRTGSRVGSRPSTPQLVPLYDKDLIRMMAEVTFINGESLVQLLRSENVQLTDKPIPPEDKSKRPKGYIAKKPEEDPDWIDYCQWIKGLSEQATNAFLRGLALGIELDEPWIVCCAATYLWNYNNHILSQGRYTEIVPQLTTVLAGLKKVGHAGETVMLINICNALAKGLIKPWIPEPPKDEKQSEAGDLLSPKAKGGKGGGAPAKSKISGVSISNDAMPDLKKAIEVCEFAMLVTNGDNPRDMVPIFMRMPILQTWVRVKQMAQQQISRHLGTDDETNPEGQRPMTRAIVAVEMLSLTKNGIMEFKDVPFIGDIAQMVEDAKWSDKFVELQMWTRLTYLAFDAHLHNMVVHCSKKALRFAAQGTQPRTRKMDTHRYSVEQEMLSYSSMLLGQSLVENMKGKNSLCREAMEAFLNGAKYARTAGNYELVMTAARHFWNTSIPLVGQPIERELLKEPLKIILECITATSEKAKKEEKSPSEPEEEKKECIVEKDQEESSGKNKKDQRESKAVESKPTKSTETEAKQSGMIGNPEDDLTLRAAMYGVLFQSYADQGEWMQALESIDKAVNDMPRTKHRLLIFKHRVMVKAKLGRSVHMDIQKFKDESEDFVAHIWRRVALSSKESLEQLASYQSAIEALENESNGYQKVEYLLEFGQWLYSNHFPLGDAQDQIEWACDILFNIKPPDEPQEDIDSPLHIDSPLPNEDNVLNEDEDIDEAAPKQTEPKKGGKGARRRATSASGSKSSLGKGKKGDKDVTPRRNKTPDKAGKKPGHRDSARSKTSVDKKGSQLVKPDSSAGSIADKTSEISDQDSEINAVDYVPVVKETEIGVLPANTQLTINDLSEVRQIDALIRSYVLLAEITGKESEQHKDILLMAHSLIMRLWRVLINACATVIKEVVKNGGTLVKEEHPKSGKGGKDKKDDKDKKKEEKPKLKRKCPVDVIPTDLETWATYDWPDEGIEAFKMDILKTVAISHDNIPKPMLTLLYTDSLISQLRDIGYNHLTLPVLAFQDLLSRTVLANNALNKLVHLRSLEVCQELDIKSGSSHHMKIIGPMHISEEDQAVSRNEIAQWNEKQIQVAKEEQRVKETLSKMTADSPSRPKAPPSKAAPRPSEVVKADIPEVELHLGKVLGSISLREIWTDTAEVLIRQGLYQRAREFLNEANIAAEAFADKTLLARIMLLLAKLSYYEAQYGQAISLCQAAQELKEGDEEFWFETINLLAKATIKEKYDIRSVRTTKKILVYAINEFSKVGDENPNRRNVIKYYCARLEAKLLKVHLRSILHSHKDVNKPQVLQSLLEGCERYETIAEHLVNMRYWRKAVHVIMRHAELLQLLATESTDKELRRVYYIQTFNVMKQAVFIAERLYLDIHTLFPLAEMKAINTPVERELSAMNIDLGDLLTDVLVCRGKELRQIQLKEERKQSITRLVEEYIREPPSLEEKEKQWIELGRIAGDEAMALLLSAHIMCLDIPRLKSKSLVSLGKLMRVVSEYQGPDPPAQWMVHDVEVLKMQLAAEEAEAEAARAEAEAEAAAIAVTLSEEGEGVIAVEEGFLAEDTPDAEQEGEEEEKTDVVDEKQRKKEAKNTLQMISKKKQHETSKYFFMCASECLAQGLNICLQHHFTDLAAKASLEMVLVIGQHDPSAASMMLSLHQSCQASLALENVLFKSQPDPLTSRLAALLHQRQHILKKDISTNLGTSVIYKEIMASLHSDWQAWKKLEVTANHLDLLKDFPANYNLIILQHSPDGSFLYGAVLDKPKGAGPTGAVKGKGQDKSKDTKIVREIFQTESEAAELLPGVSRARIFGGPTEFSQLEEILSKLHTHTHQQQSILLKREYQRMQAAQREKMLESLEEDHKNPVKPFNTEMEFEETQLEEEFEGIVGAMNAYLRPVLEPVCNSLRSSNTSLGSNPNIAHEGGGKDKGSKDSVPQNECAILLADPDLMRLPLEASMYLDMLEGVNAVSRDFSLQLLYNRYQDDKQVEVEGKDAKGGEGKKKPSKEPTNFVTRIPGLREAKQKQAKIIPLDRHPQPWQGVVNTNDFRFFVDPFLDCAVTETHKPIQDLKKILEKYEQQFTPRWLGVPGDDHTPSIGEWEIYLSESSSFIFYGLEKLLSYIPPHKMSALNLPDCNILFSFDLAETAKSFQRHSKLDVLKTPLALSLERPVESAMLTSLTGIKCLICNQWNSTLEENSRKFNDTMTYLLQKGKTTGQTLYLLQNPIKVYEEEKATQKATEAAKEQPEASKERKKSISNEKGSAKESRRDSKSVAQSDVSKTPALKVEEADPDKDKEEPKEDEMPVVTRAAFNTVCYGMPNLIVTQ